MKIRKRNNLFKPLGIKPHTNYYVETAEEHKAFTIGKLPKRQYPPNFKPAIFDKVFHSGIY